MTVATSTLKRVSVIPARPHLLRQRMRCLWIAADAAHGGTARADVASFLASALARSQVHVHYARTGHAHMAGTQMQLLRCELAEQWDAIILDGQSSAWALPLCQAARASSNALLVYISRPARPSAVGDVKDVKNGSASNVLPHDEHSARLERELLAHMDLVTVITDEAATSPSAAHASSAMSLKHGVTRARSPHQLILTPGYVGKSRPTAELEATPRRIMLVGSFVHTEVQQELLDLVNSAAASLTQHQVGLDIVGVVPAPLQQQLQNRLADVHIRTDAADPSLYAQTARVALIWPQDTQIKSQLLTHIFCRMPVATLCSAAASLPAALRTSVLCEETLPSLLHTAIAGIDRLDALNELQHQAYVTAQSLFDWNSRGEQLRNTMQLLCQR